MQSSQNRKYILFREENFITSSISVEFIIDLSVEFIIGIFVEIIIGIFVEIIIGIHFFPILFHNCRSARYLSW